MTAVASVSVSRGGTTQEQVQSSPISTPVKSQSPFSQPQTQNPTEVRMMSLLGRKKAIKEMKNSKLVIRRLPQEITMDELAQFLAPLPEHSYFYIARGDPDFSREDTLFARAYINLSRQEDASSFCSKLDGYPLKSGGHIYRPVIEFAPFHRVPKRNAVKSDGKEGTIDSDQDYKAFLKSLEDRNTKQLVEERNGVERSKDSHQTTPLIQHLIQKHEQKQLRAGGGGRGGGYGSEPKIIKKRAPGGAKDSDFNSYTTSVKDRKTFRGPSASVRGPVSSDSSQKLNPKAGPVIIVTDKSHGGKKGVPPHVHTEGRSASPYDSYPKPAQNAGKEYAGKHAKANSNHSVAYYDSSDRGGYSSHSRRGKKSGRGGKYSSGYYSGAYGSDTRDWEYDRGGYERRDRYDDWYPSEGEGRGSKRREDRGRNADWDSNRYYSSRGDRHY